MKILVSLRVVIFSDTNCSETVHDIKAVLNLVMIFDID